MTKPLPQNKIREIRQHFEFFDRDHNGAIDADEFAQLLKAIEPKAKPAECLRGFREVDSDHDGQIDFTEFLTWWQKTWWQF